ncbi:thiamine phosphate synthase [uncultured Faecalibaculum sp.]|uniref:thiamine phosphate synthase n=1 Tax=uncultured Faecalibaculum sp. TaxID=1729681 RepID=UPI00261BEE08|nr:thiamine phosphate synthase [uncultured Faecalibaculum sp.]
MKFGKDNMRLYAVTDRAWTGETTLQEQVEQALKGGVTCLQLREKDLDASAFLEEADAIRELCHQYCVPFIVNDSLDIALASQADGIHVGQDDLPAAEIRKRAGKDLIVGVSVHNVQEALQAVRDGADYLGVGAMFSTSTKADAQVLPLDTLRDICDAVDVPVVAIGGIHTGNISDLAGTGVDGVALVSAIFGAADIEKACRELRNLSEQMVKG